MNSILLHEGTLLRRMWQDHFGDIKSWVSLLVAVGLAAAVTARNLPNLQSALSEFGPGLFIPVLMILPLVSVALLHWRIDALGRGSLVAAAALRKDRLWPLFVAANVLGCVAALAVLSAMMGPRLTADGTATASFAFTIWFCGGLLAWVVIGLSTSRFSRAPWRIAQGRATAPFQERVLLPRHPALEALLFQQSLRNSFGLLSLMIWATPVVIMAAAAAARFVAPAALTDLTGASLIAAFAFLLLLGRVDYRTVRFLRLAGFGRRASTGIHLVAPLAYALILLAAGALLLFQTLQVLVTVAAALLLVTASTILRVLSYRELGRAEAELNIQKWLWMCALVGVVFLPAAIVVLGLWGRHLVKLGTNEPLD